MKLVMRLSESIVAKYLGWVPGTRMTKVYVHLADQDVDKAILGMYGIEKNDETEMSVLRCPRCTSRSS
jgi:CRISPR/Cas system CSM-associated protein Csm5 (group 7 of RAMP superfamily)